MRRCRLRVGLPEAPWTPDCRPVPLMFSHLFDEWRAIRDWTEQNNFGSLRALDKQVKVELAPVNEGYNSPRHRQISVELCEFASVSCV